MNNSRKSMIIVIFIVGALILLGVAANFAVEIKKFNDGAVEVKGRVLRVESYESKCGTRNPKPCTKYNTFVSFSSLNEGTTKEDKIDGNFSGHQELDLLYNPSVTPSLHLKQDFPWMKPLIFVFVAVIDLVIVLPIVLFAISKGKRE
jgi:hypothetical protein